MVSFDVTRDEAHTIRAIVERADTMAREVNDGEGVDKLSLAMDLTACHANGCPLELERLLAADDFNFAHDVFGIMRHMDRRTGRLGNCFLPRHWRKPSTPSSALADKPWLQRETEEAATIHPSAWQALQPADTSPAPLGYEAASCPAEDPPAPDVCSGGGGDFGGAGASGEWR